MDKAKKIIHILLLIFVAITILTADIRAVKNIRNRKTEIYKVENYGISVCELQNGEISTIFYPVSRRIQSLWLCCECDGEIEGTVDFLLLDDGNIVLNRQENSFGELWDESLNCLVLDVSDVNFTSGDKYVFQVTVNLDGPISVKEDANGVLHYQNYQVEYQALLYVLLVLVNLFMIGSILAFLKWGWNDKLFLVVACFVGLFVVFCRPPYAEADEFRHFVRAYDLSYGGNKGYYGEPPMDGIGNIMPDEDGMAFMINLPKELSEMRLVDYTENYTNRGYLPEVNYNLCAPKLFSIFYGEEKTGNVTVSEVATNTRGMEGYWPQAVMIFLGRKLRIRSGMWYYLACIGQMMIATLFFWFAHKLVKQYSVIIWILAFLPPGILLRSSCNPDGLMMAEIVLAIVIILHLREEKISLKTWKGALLFVAYLVLVWQVFRMKAPYALVCLGCLLFLKKENFDFLFTDAVRKYKKGILFGTLGFFILALIYVFGVRKGQLFLNLIYQYLPKAHLDYLLAHLRTMIPLFLHKGWFLLQETKLALRGSYLVSYFTLSILTLLFCKKNFAVGWKMYQVFLFLCMLGIVVMVGYTMTPPDYGFIWGVTARYILPSLSLVALALPFGNEKTEEWVKMLASPLLIATMGACMLSWIRI